MSNQRPYVYVIFVDGVERYIGKGLGKRKDDHVRRANLVNKRRGTGEKVRTNHFYNRLAKAIRDGATIKSEVICYFRTEREAFTEEVLQIASRDGLWNTFKGGNGFDSAFVKQVIWGNEEFRRRKLAQMSSPEAIKNVLMILTGTRFQLQSLLAIEYGRVFRKR
jgi:hypothetical protein